MDPATISLIISGLISGIRAIDALGQANSGLTEDQRAARRQLRKDLVDLAELAAEPIEVPEPLPGD